MWPPLLLHLPGLPAQLPAGVRECGAQLPAGTYVTAGEA